LNADEAAELSEALGGISVPTVRINPVSEPMPNSYPTPLRFVRSVLWIALAFMAVLTLLLVLDFTQSGVTFNALTSVDLVQVRHINNMLNRNLNQLVAVVFTSVAIAVPLTANMYSLKFLEFFIKDRVNAAVLSLVVFTNLANTWVGFWIRPDFLPVLALDILLGLTLLCFALQFPYLYHVFRFLHPSFLLDRLEAEVREGMQLAVRRPGQAERYQLPVAGGIEHIANVAVRSIDRLDRNTAIECVLALEHLLRHYWSLKARLPEGWFTADPNQFLGFSSKAIEEFTETRTWVEMKLFSQLRQVLSASVGRVHDVASAVAKATRRLGQAEAALAETAVRETVLEYFNTYLRLTITRRDARSVYIVLDQYRSWAESLNARYPDFVQEIAFYFTSYGDVAHDNQLPFIVEAVAYDLGALVQLAWRTESPNRHKLLERLLFYDQQHAARPLEGVKKAQAILASYFMVTGQPAPVERIRKTFVNLEPRLLHEIADDLLHVRRAKYWEVSERRLNMDYVPDAQRAKLREFFEGLGVTIAT
jgi:hypothetical protein